RRKTSGFAPFSQVRSAGDAAPRRGCCCGGGGGGSCQAVLQRQQQWRLDERRQPARNKTFHSVRFVCRFLEFCIDASTFVVVFVMIRLSKYADDGAKMRSLLTGTPMVHFKNNFSGARRLAAATRADHDDEEEETTDSASTSSTASGYGPTLRGVGL